MATAEQLIEDFETYGIAISEKELVEKCLELCSQYSVDGEGLAICWMAFATSNGYSCLSLEHLEHFERDQLVKEKKNAVKKVESIQMYDINTISSVQDDDDLLAAYGGTPTTKTSKRQITPDNNVTKRHVNSARSISAQFSPATLSRSVATPSQKYSSRTNAGGVVASYGDVSKASWTSSKDFIPQLEIMAMTGDTPLTESYKYMFDKLRDVAEVLNDTITLLGDEIKDTLKVEEYSSLKSACNEVITVCGRICCDSVGRLNAASVLLEGSREASGGDAVQVDLSQLAEFSLFPGQIVGIQGLNTTGNKLVAQKLVPGKILPLPDSPITIKNDTGPVQVIVACGPFTTTDNLLYEPLTDLLMAIQNNPPHLLILMGPLLDVAHPLVANNELNETHDSVFNRCVRIITNSLEDIGTRVVLVSSNRDACSHMVYPTPPYSIGGHLTCVSDPSLLEVEGVVIAVTATDILFHLGKEEISFPPQGSDRLGRLTSHILRQQSLYPLYPPPEGMCVDLDQMETHARLPCTPHLLILPSDLRYFIRDLEGCVVVNPERLAKGLVGGTFARLELHPPSQERGSMVGSVNAQIVKV
ncbi:DNA polymerase alpha subunit B isoform X2 [Macrobrachium rosenbergii]|uniref:DNA polymerase alpha subunit B isoform X2 n=1 Tax=Macrobrachium rosenbergii TaxID=79674 RepID=UPI0034D57144